MLQLPDNYLQIIRDMGEDPQVFPISPEGGWGSSLSFSSDFADMTFGELVFGIFPIDNYKAMEIEVGSIVAARLELLDTLETELEVESKQTTITSI